MTQKINSEVVEGPKGFSALDAKIKNHAAAPPLAGISGSAALPGLFAFLTTRTVNRRNFSLDKDFKKWLSDNHHKPLGKYLRSYSLAGKEPVTRALAVAAFVFLMRRKQPLAAWLVLISTWSGWLLSRPVKSLGGRPRPLSLNTLENHPNAYSFPSGHSVVAVCFYGMLTWLDFKLLKGRLSRWGWALLMVNLILMIRLSRAYLKEHLLRTYWAASG